MKMIADPRRRVTLPKSVAPGDVFSIDEEGPGRFVLVRLEKPPKGRPASVWDRRADFEKKHGRFTEDFTLPPREKQTWRNPLDD